MTNSNARNSASRGKSQSRQYVPAIPKDEATQRLILKGMGRLHATVETNLRRGVSLAQKGRSTAFREIDRLVTFLEHELDPKSPHRTEVAPDSKPSRTIGAGALVGLRCLDQRALRRPLNAIRDAISAWQPQTRKRDQRPPIILGPLDYCLAKQKELEDAANAESPKNDEQTKIEEIIDAVQELLELVAQLRSRIADQLAGPKKPEKRRWTQQDVDDCVRRLVKEHGDLIQAAKLRKRGTSEAARRVFGRNAIHRKYGMSQASISKSKEWRKIAQELGLERKESELGRSRGLKKIGSQSAQDAASQARNDDPADDMIRQDLRWEIEGILASCRQEDRMSYEELLDDLDQGRSVDEIEEILDRYRAQQIDDRTRRFRSKP